MLCKNIEVNKSEGDELLKNKMKKYAEEHYYNSDLEVTKVSDSKKDKDELKLEDNIKCGNCASEECKKLGPLTKDDENIFVG